MKKLAWFSLLALSTIAFAQWKCASCADVIDYNGSLHCVTGSSYTYCTCGAPGSCPQISEQCGSCNFRLNPNCTDCCPGCHCYYSLVAAKKTAARLSAWADDPSIVDQVSAFDKHFGMVVKKLQHDKAICTSGHARITVLDQDDHKTMHRFIATVSKKGSIVVERDNGQKFIADRHYWQILDKNTLLSGDVRQK